MYRNETVKIQILRTFGEQHPGFKKAAFAGLDTPQTSDDGCGWKEISFIGIKISEGNYKFICCFLCDDKEWTEGLFQAE